MFCGYHAQQDVVRCQRCMRTGSSIIAMMAIGANIRLVVMDELVNSRSESFEEEKLIHVLRLGEFYGRTKLAGNEK